MKLRSLTYASTHRMVLHARVPRATTVRPTVHPHPPPHRIAIAVADAVAASLSAFRLLSALANSARHRDDDAALACSSFIPKSVARLATSYGPRSSVACRLPPAMTMPPRGLDFDLGLGFAFGLSLIHI